jgi:hypothetical protein
LRAEAARFLEWFRICLRFGWLAGHKTLKRGGSPWYVGAASASGTS